MIRLKNFYFWGTLLLLTLLALAAALPYVLFSGIAGLFGVNFVALIRYGIWWYSHLFILLLHPLAPLRIEVPDMALTHAPCIIAPNHQSFLDLYLLAAQNCKNFAVVVGMWPFRKLFFFALFMRLGKYVRTGRPEYSFQFMENCRQILQNGGCLIGFPEGTRSRSGELGAFNDGIFRVAVESGVPLVPMVYCNSGKICPPGSFRVNPQPIYIKMLEPLVANRALSARQACADLRERTRAAMQAALTGQ